MRDKLAAKKKPIPAELSDLKHPGDPPAPPWDYPIFFATSQRSGRDNSGEPAYKKGADGEILTESKEVLVHNEQGDLVLAQRQRKVLDCDLDEIAEAFTAWGREQSLDFFAPSPNGLLSWREVAEGADVDTSEVWACDLERTKRIDAEHYHPRYLELEAILAHCPTKYLPQVCYVTDGNHFKVSDYFMSEGEYRYLRGQDLTDFFVGETNPVYVPREIFDSLAPSHMKPLDVLLSIVGTIGAVGIIPPDWPVITGSCKLAILRAQEMDPYYLAVFWASRYGKFQAARNTRGTVQMGLVLDDFPYLQVVDAPLAFQDEIAKLVRAAYKQRQESKRLYWQAEQRLLGELGLSDLDLSDGLFNEATLIETWAAKRIDGEFFQAKYRELEIALQQSARQYNLRLAQIRDLSAPLRYGTSEKLDYLDEGIPFLRITDLQGYFFESDSLTHISPSVVDSLGDARVRVGDVIVSRTGTLGVAVAIPEKLNGSVFGSYFIRSRPDSNVVLPSYLALYLNSPLGQIQVQRFNTGAIQTNLTIPAIENLKVIIPSKDSQEKIVKTVDKSIGAREHARQLLKQATREVEALIESEAAHG